MKKRLFGIMLFLSLTTLAIACSKKGDNVSKDHISKKDNDKVITNQDKAKNEVKKDTQEPVTLLIAAAASMQPSLEEIKVVFQDKYPHITVESTYDSSGKLQTQIEEGLEADVFLSAGMKQMNALKDNKLVDEGSIIELLENKIVLIIPSGIESKVSGFDDILNAEHIAIGDPASVPAGQYAKEILEYLGNYEKVVEKASLGTNVTEVLNWVAQGSAEVGIVYATDAATTDKVTVIGYAPEVSLKQPVIYPIGIVSGTKNQEAAELYLEFLQSKECQLIFEMYGFLVK